MSVVRCVVVGLTLGAAANTASAQVVVPNSGFEDGNLGTGNYLYPNGTYQSWTYRALEGNGSALVNAQGASVWFGATPPVRTHSTQFAALQRTSEISDVVTVSSANTYQFYWLAAGRPAVSTATGTGGNQSYTFRLFDNATDSLVTAATVSTFTTTTGSAFNTAYIVYRDLQPGTYQILFDGQATTDQTAFIDNVLGRALTTPAAAIQPAFGFSAGGVPEPASWALMILGFGLVGFTQRRRVLA